MGSNKTYDTVDEMFADLQASYKESRVSAAIDKIFPNGLAGYAPHYTLSHPWVAAVCVANCVRWAWQRVFRGWDDRVIWSIDWYLARRLPAWLRRLKRLKHGIPMFCFEDMSDDSPSAMEKATVKWNAEIDTMVAGFEAAIRITEYEDTYVEDMAMFKSGMRSFTKHFFDLWD